MKKFIGIVGIGLICCLIVVILWKEKDPERNEKEIDNQYQYKDGSYAADTWLFLDFEMYHIDKDGWMQVGWIEVDGNNYYLNEDGIMLRDVFTEEGYYVNRDGVRTADQLMEGDGITYMVNTAPRGKDSGWDMYYYDIPTFNHYELHEGKVFERWDNALTPEMLHKINMEAVEENSIILNYENYKDGYCSQQRYIDYDEAEKKAIVIGEYEKIVDQTVEENGNTYGGTALIKRYNLETGELVEETEDQLK